MRRVAILCVALLASSATASDDDTELTPEQVTVLRAAVERLRKDLGFGPLTAEKAWAFDVGEFTAEELKVAPDALPAELPDDVRAAFRHVCRTAALRLGPLGRLGKARDICYLLGSPRLKDWLKASRLLRHEPLTDELDRAVMSLVKDERPEVRLLASELSASLVVFGRTNEGLMGTVLACLRDQSPNVVAMCSFEALSTRDKRVIDCMVACVSDDRAFDRGASPVLYMGPTATNLRDFVQWHLSWTFWKERRARWKFEPPRFDAAGNRLPGHEPVYVLLSPDEIRAWWKENRGTFAFGTPAPQWRCVFDKVLLVDVGKRLDILDADGRPLTIDLKVFREHWGDDGPETAIEGDIRSNVLSEEVHVAGFNLDGRGGVSRERGSWGDGTLLGEVDCRASFLPTDKPGRVRMKLTMHIGHLER